MAENRPSRPTSRFERLARCEDTVYLPPGVPIRLIMRFSGYADPGWPYMAPNVAPGYLTRPAETSDIDDSFDEDGFYRTGDAGRLSKPAEPSHGRPFLRPPDPVTPQTLPDKLGCDRTSASLCCRSRGRLPHAAL